VLDSGDEVPGFGAGADLLASALQCRSRRRNDERAGGGRAQPLVTGELVHGRQVAQLHERSLGLEIES
jgi:hypothetical protein